MAKSIKREQEVVVIAGSHKGKRGKVLEIMGNDRVLVEGVNMITKYERKTQENPEGSSIQREASIHYSNVMLAEKFDTKVKSKK
ncbi:MAG: 50S ribosomal protein L24 [Puniceicoccaceae bacterium MED-G32]|jgi:large subunit ribosomal protein L24|nr:50S ribosomal protein L24 [Puniceicoccaceae bacterium]PDH27302.1 MAG: 50S ribosomal protein L24 [Puniceicoccaceae bacterium MED-G32]CAI8260516.1 MAG: 50S ribosomal protein L24 [Puniceicoccaceae bacterium MED-G32]|tara:strand:+ start:6077 stop:6328 length:252 start_codon:yes stop_codon:yes gene_type:complete